jgi:membrane protein
MAYFFPGCAAGHCRRSRLSTPAVQAPSGRSIRRSRVRRPCVERSGRRPRSRPRGDDAFGDPGARLEGHPASGLRQHFEASGARSRGRTYYSILAIFPAIAALVALYGLFSDPTTIAKHLDQAAGFLPGGAIDIAREQLSRVTSKGSQTLGVTFLIGLATSLWSANAAMKSLFDTLNIVHGEEDKRGFFKLNAISLGFTIGGVAFILSALGSIVVVPVALCRVGGGAH